MTTPTAAGLLARYPEFVAIPAARLDVLISDAMLWLRDDWWGDEYEQIIYLVACHWLASAPDGMAALASYAASLGPGFGQPNSGISPTGQPLDSEKVGDVMVTYNTAHLAAMAAKAGSKAGYLATPYGRRYLEYAAMMNLGAIAL